MAEIIRCPNCQRELRLPDQFLGQQVQCPECQHTFVASSSSVSSQPIPPTPTPASAPAKPRRYEDDDDIDERPRRRREFDDDDFDDDIDFRDPRRLRNRYAPHRGGMILALGLVALVGGLSICVPAIVGPVAWALGSWDLREIRDGRMDPEGESMTRTGQVCGIVATVMLLLGTAGICLMIAAG